MAFADLKNDYIFRRIFGTHPDILRGLLNDLLERTGDRAIEGIEYLPSEQLPIADGAKLSILDVRCKDRAGTTFVVEMQLIHHPGFIDRVVYNACKAYVGQLQAGQWYTDLMHVVAISICDFELWPEEKQRRDGLPPVPMLSRWAMMEQKSQNHGLLQVQYAFLELPKVPKERPEGRGAGLWAWLFAHAPELGEVPADLAPGPYREALELANQAKFTQQEMESYARSRDEIRQVLEIAAARWAEGVAEGEATGEVRGRRAALYGVLATRGVAVSAEVRGRIEGCGEVGVLDRWIARAVAVGAAEEMFVG
jgi:hypothetical protein